MGSTHSSIICLLESFQCLDICFLCTTINFDVQKIMSMNGLVWYCYGKVFFHFYVVLLITPLFLCPSLVLVSLISPPPFLNKVKSLSHVLSSLSCTHLSFSLTDTLLGHFIVILNELIFTSFIHNIFQFVLHSLISVQELVVVTLFNFYKHSKSAPFHTILPYLILI